MEKQTTPPPKPRPAPQVKKVAVFSYATANGSFGYEAVTVPKPPWEDDT